METETKIEITRLCESCIGAIKSRGERIFVGGESESENLDGTCKCEFCDDETITYDCFW